jgi:hypothetical protein
VLGTLIPPPLLLPGRGDGGEECGELEARFRSRVRMEGMLKIERIW